MLADPYITKRALSVKRLIEYGLLRDSLGRRLVPLDLEEAERRLKEREKEEIQ